jgi:hypothetical protein
MRLVIGLVATTVSAPLIGDAAPPPDATALFDQGIKDMQAGNTDAACRELAASLARYSDSGTKGALAECYTKLGKIASAWNLWRDLADTEPDPSLRQDAVNNAKQLEARLPHFIVKLDAPIASGIQLVVRDTAVADATLAVPLPIDPGTFTVRASAPDYNDWTGSFQVTEGQTIVVEVSPLVAKPKPVVAQPREIAQTPPASFDDERDAQIATTRRSRHVLGISIAGGGLVAVGVGGVFGGIASSQWTTAKKDCGETIEMCPANSVSKAQSEVNSARASALTSTIAMGVGGAALIAGAIAYLMAPNGEHASATALQITPVVESTSVGMMLLRNW